MVDIITKEHIKALKLAFKNCKGKTTQGDIEALRQLNLRGFVKAVRTDMSAYYTITTDGLLVLLAATAKPFIDSNVVDETSGTIPLMESLRDIIDEVESGYKIKIDE